MNVAIGRPHSAVVTVLVAGIVGSLAACGSRAPIPNLYTNANSADVWNHPTNHLGARLDIRVTLEGVTSLNGSAVATVGVDKHNVAVHVFDPRFRARTGSQLRVTGIVRGALGAADGLGPQGKRVQLPRGTAVIDAQAVSSLDGSPVTVSPPPPAPPPCAKGAPRRPAHCQTAAQPGKPAPTTTTTTTASATARAGKPAPTTTSSATETSQTSTPPR
jgi:hypothetical protein